MSGKTYTKTFIEIIWGCLFYFNVCDLFSWMYVCAYVLSVFLNFPIVLHGTFISETLLLFYYVGSNHFSRMSPFIISSGLNQGLPRLRDTEWKVAVYLGKGTFHRPTDQALAVCFRQAGSPRRGSAALSLASPGRLLGCGSHTSSSPDTPCASPSRETAVTRTFP